MGGNFSNKLVYSENPSHLHACVRQAVWTWTAGNSSWGSEFVYATLDLQIKIKKEIRKLGTEQILIEISLSQQYLWWLGIYRYCQIKGMLPHTNLLVIWCHVTGYVAFSKILEIRISQILIFIKIRFSRQESDAYVSTKSSDVARDVFVISA